MINLRMIPSDITARHPNWLDILLARIHAQDESNSKIRGDWVYRWRSQVDPSIQGTPIERPPSCLVTLVKPEPVLTVNLVGIEEGGGGSGSMHASAAGSYLSITNHGSQHLRHSQSRTHLSPLEFSGQKHLQKSTSRLQTPGHGVSRTNLMIPGHGSGLSPGDGGGHGAKSMNSLVGSRNMLSRDGHTLNGTARLVSHEKNSLIAALQAHAHATGRTKSSDHLTKQNDGFLSPNHHNQHNNGASISRLSTPDKNNGNNGATSTSNLLGSSNSASRAVSRGSYLALGVPGGLAGLFGQGANLSSHNLVGSAKNNPLRSGSGGNNGNGGVGRVSTSGGGIGMGGLGGCVSNNFSSVSLIVPPTPTVAITLTVDDFQGMQPAAWSDTSSMPGA
jgi:hypothetical protein